MADAADAADEPVEAAPQDREGRRWSPVPLLVLCLATVAVAAAVVHHLGTVFLSIAPSNPVSRRHSAAIEAHVLPEFEQNWQVFAPNPLQGNIAIQARGETIGSAGDRTDSPWLDLTAKDVAAIRGNPFPSHLNQNQLRRAWDSYLAWHDRNGSSTGVDGPLSEEYLKRIGLQRIGLARRGQRIVRIQFRSATTDITGPAWTGAPATTSPSYRELPWWPAGADDYRGLGVS